MTRLARGFELLSLAPLLLSWTLFLLVYRLVPKARVDLRVAARTALWAYVSSVVLVFGAAMAPGAPARR